MSVRLLMEYHLEFLSLTGGCTGSSESTYVKIPHCWKSHVTAQLSLKGALIAMMKKVCTVLFEYIDDFLFILFGVILK